jgi:hypothetical protein
MTAAHIGAPIYISISIYSLSLSTIEHTGVVFFLFSRPGRPIDDR